MSSADSDNPPVSDNAKSPAAGPGDRDVLIRSEEQLRVNTRRVPARRARLEKYLVTETSTVTVQLTHEQVRLVFEPLSQDPVVADQSHGVTIGDVGLADEQQWLTLHREQVVISTVVVPVERVRLETFPVTEHQVITEDLAREQVDVHTNLIDGPDPKTAPH